MQDERRVELADACYWDWRADVTGIVLTIHRLYIRTHLFSPLVVALIPYRIWFLRQPVSVISQGYPRGSKQLIGPFSSLFGPADAAAWFGERGVTLKTEGDGRMFPTTDDSQTIIDCLEGTSCSETGCVLRVATSCPYPSCIASLDVAAAVW